MSYACAYKDVALVRSFTGIPISDSRTDAHKLHKISTAYDPIVETCVTLHTRKGLPNAIGFLVVDVFLLLTMLIGLLRHASRSSTGIWKLLYQQVTLKTFSLSCAGY